MEFVSLTKCKGNNDHILSETMGLLNFGFNVKLRGNSCLLLGDIPQTKTVIRQV